MREHVVGVDDVGALALGDELGARAQRRRTRRASGSRALRATCAMFRAGSMPEHRHAGLLVVLEQVAVVARDLDDQARRPERRARGRRGATSSRACSSIVSENDEK